MKKSFYFLLSLALTAVGVARAQKVAFYAFESKDSTWTSIQPDSNLFNTTSSTADEDFSSNIRIGFSFPYRGVSKTALAVSANGVISLNRNNALTNLYTGSGSTMAGTALGSANSDIIALLDGDMVVPQRRNVGIKRGVQNGERYFAVMFTGFRRFGTTFTGDSLNVQAWLWQSGRITLMYGPSKFATPENSLQVGIRGTSNADVVSITGSWANPERGSATTDRIPMSSTNHWESARTLTFRPPVAGPVNVLASTLTLPGSTNMYCGTSATQTLTVRITNVGTDSLHSADVGYTINNGTVVQQTVTFQPPLAPGSSQVITFNGARAADLSGSGPFDIAVFATALNDVQASNDTVRTRVTNTGANLVLPSSRSFANFDSLTGPGWRIGYGPRGVLTTTTGNEITEYIDNRNSRAGIAMSSFTDNTNAWLVRDGIQNESSYPKSVAFKLKVGSSATSPINQIGDDDSLNVRFSTDCGTTWQTLRSFTQEDLDNGIIGVDESLQNVPLPALTIGERFSVAFQFTSGGTAAPSYYYWFVDSVLFGGEPDVQALAVSNVKRFLGFCSEEPQTVGIKYRNNSFVEIDTLVVSYSINGGPEVTELVVSPLEPAATDSIIFSQPFVATSGGTQLVVVSVKARGDGIVLNDTLSFRSGFGKAQTVPRTPVIGLSNLFTAGYSTGTGRNGQGPGGWTNSVVYGPLYPTAAALIDSALNRGARQELWLISPAFRSEVTGGVNLQFNLSVTPIVNQTQPTNGLGSDDSLSVYYRINCGQWQFVHQFGRADYDAGRVRNTLSMQIVNIPAITVADSFQVAFVATDNATRPTAPYRWYIGGLVVTDVAGTSQSLTGLGLRLFPNPARNMATLEGLTGSATIAVQDIQGRVLRTQSATVDNNRLDLTGLQAGIYVLRIATAKGTAIQRLVIE